MPVHWIDLVIVAIVAWSAFSAFRRGLIRQLVSVLSVIAGGLIAAHLHSRLAANIDFIVEDETTRKLIAFAAIFAGIVVLGQILSMLLRTAAGLLMLGPIDHLGGAAFGVLQGLLIVLFLLFALSAFPASERLTEALQESTLAPYFLDRLPLVERLLPAEFRDAIESFDVGMLPFPGGLPLPMPLPGR
jgi:membrane protein required for colicin V production